jgi:hypothetical protein
MELAQYALGLLIAIAAPMAAGAFIVGSMSYCVWNLALLTRENGFSKIVAASVAAAPIVFVIGIAVFMKFETVLSIAAFVSAPVIIPIFIMLPQTIAAPVAGTAPILLAIIAIYIALGRREFGGPKDISPPMPPATGDSQQKLANWLPLVFIVAAWISWKWL